MSQRPPPNAPRPATVDAALEAAGEALRRGRLAEAERLAGGVLKARRADARAARLLGQALLLQGKADAAADALRPLARRSADPALETLLARALADGGHADAALEQLRQATTRRPPYPLAFLELGDALGRAGRFGEAAEVFEAGLALAPEALVLEVGLGFLRLQTDDRAAARRHFAEVRAAAPERFDAMIGLARTAALDGAFAEAAELYRLVLARQPGDVQSRIGLGRCLLELGDRAAGEAALREAARLAPDAAGAALNALAAVPRGRAFLRPSDAERFLGRR
ncbi:MAG: tetratricopeptide repeat protein [Phenylobacterium sp.]|uniref:tetratricopeptide repeat protein n=1 Tax=Phenylobacterium sp. TaxID=1871053 RepID=UPI001A604E25|nr:tetratricopeptide repeat protein [Phenylobacterium sp.]MBL8557046.1 tetratricopeptide repeat protein [Phenylobacterium sp.]